MSESSFGKGVGDGVTLAALVVRDAGALINSPRAGVMRFMPALNVGPAEIDDMVGVGRGSGPGSSLTVPARSSSNATVRMGG
jgi:hypothetical protein